MFLQVGSEFCSNIHGVLLEQALFARSGTIGPHKEAMFIIKKTLLFAFFLLIWVDFALGGFGPTSGFPLAEDENGHILPAEIGFCENSASLG